MELMQEVKGYSDSREEEEEEEAAEEILTTTREESSSKHHYPPFSSPSLSLSSSPSTTNHHHHHHDVINIPPHQQNPWLGMIHDHHHHHHHSPDATESHNSSSGLGFLHQHQDVASSNFTNQTNLKQLDFMELSLGNNKDVSNEANFQAPPLPHATTAPSSSTNQQPIEKEHMFDKVVTPSDVGKLNRLVIPKQHAEKYFPLDSTSNEKGLLLNFEDRNGKLWRFRYSYWNSSQSYVMTKGWSRFVKEKKLDAGDIVSFQRGVGDLHRHRLYIDWRRRSNHIINGSDHSTTLFTPFFLPNHPPPPHLSQYSIRWGAPSRLYPLPSPQTPRHQHHDPLQQLNCNYHMYPFHQQHHGGGIGNHHYNYHEMSSGSRQHGSVYYMRSAPPQPSMPMPDQTILTRQQEEEGGANVSPMIIDSVPVAHHHHHHHHHHGGKSGSSSTNTNTAAKRLRLFGVNMECGSSSNEDTKCYSLMSTTSVANVTMANSIPSSSLQPLQHLRVPHEDTLSPSTRFGDKRREASMLFDLDPSLQYRQ